MGKGDVGIWYVLRVSFPERGDVEVIVTSRATPRDSAGIADANGYDATWHTRLGAEGPQDIIRILRIGNVR